MSDFLEGWGDLTPAPEAAGEPTGELSELAAQLVADPESLALLKDAILGAEAKAKLPVFASTAEFVEKYVTVTFRKRLKGSGLKWCEQWWRHPEARMALDAMHEDWENCRREGRMAHWLISVGWPIMDRLTGDLSPFDGCQHEVEELRAVHNPSQGKMPVGVAPEDLFPRSPTKANPGT